MKSLLQNSIIVLLFLAPLNKAASQPYEHSIGIRAGYSSGLNYKFMNRRDMFISGDALYNRFGFQFTGSLGYEISPYDRERLFYYAGAGLFGGNWEEETALGASLVCGAEFVYRKVPLVMGIEWKPMMAVYRNFKFAIPDFGVSVRFVIK